MDDLVRPRSEIKRRGRYSNAFKDKVLAECSDPNVSTAEVARRYGINDNMIYNWRAARKASSRDSFVKLPAPKSTSPKAVTVQLTAQVGQGSVKAEWPLDTIHQSVPWLRALLQ